MKTYKKRRIKKNSKTTEINCIRCNGKFRSQRNDAKFCSPLCRVQDGVERKEKGYVHLAFCGTEKGLSSLFNKLGVSAVLPEFSEIIPRVRDCIRQNNSNISIKEEGSNFRLSFYPKNKKRPIELHVNEQLKIILDIHIKPIDPDRFRNFQQ